MNPRMFEHFGPIGTNSYDYSTNDAPIEPEDKNSYGDGGRKVLSLDERRKRKQKTKMQKQSRKRNR